MMLGLGLCFAQLIFCQIQSGTNEPVEKKDKKKEKKEKVKTEFNEDSLSGINYYFTGLGMWTYRNFEDQSVYGVYKTRVDEKPTYRGGMNLGVIVPLNDFVSMDIGVTYFGTGEKYGYKDSLGGDSTYNYVRRYLQLGVPLRLRFTTGKKFQGFMYAGLTPLNVMQIRYDANYTTSKGEFIDPDEQKIKNDFSTFNLMVSMGAGVRYNIKYIGFTYSVEYRRNLLNTYEKVSIPLDHHIFAIGMNLGMYLRF